MVGEGLISEGDFWAARRKLLLEEQVGSWEISYPMSLSLCGCIYICSRLCDICFWENPVVKVFLLRQCQCQYLSIYNINRSSHPPTYPHHQTTHTNRARPAPATRACPPTSWRRSRRGRWIRRGARGRRFASRWVDARMDGWMDGWMNNLWVFWCVVWEFVCLFISVGVPCTHE